MAKTKGEMTPFSVRTYLYIYSVILGGIGKLLRSLCSRQAGLILRGLRLCWYWHASRP